MKKYIYCIIIMHMLGIKAASSSDSQKKVFDSGKKVFQKMKYSSDDYLLFKVMRETADAYFDSVNKENECFRKQKYAQGPHSLVDLRKKHPVDGAFVVAQGILIDRAKCVFYSPWGKWHFAKDYLCKSYRPIKNQPTPWQKVREAATKKLKLEPFGDSNHLFYVSGYEDRLLPRLVLKQKPVFEEKIVRSKEGEDLETEEVTLHAEPSLLSLSYLKMLLYHFIGQWFSNDDGILGVELDEDVEIEKVIPSSPKLKNKKEPTITPHKLAIWTAMNMRYEKELSSK